MVTFEINAAQTPPSGASTASDIFVGLTLALILAFLTAASILGEPHDVTPMLAQVARTTCQRAFTRQRSQQHLG